MKTSIFLTSFFSTNCRGLNPFTSPAMRVANWEASNLVIVPTPQLPAQSAAQLASVPIPSDDTRPMPVTTTRLFTIPPVRSCPCGHAAAGGLLLGLGVRLDVLDRLFDPRDLLGILVGDLDPELLLERHHQF